MNPTKKKKMQQEIKHHNEYFICLKNTIHLLKIFAIFPFLRFNETTTLGRTFSTLLTIISLTVYIVVIAKEANYLYLTYTHIRREISFTNAMRFSLQIPLRMVLLVFPFSTWNKNGNLRKYWNNWMNFQIKLKKLTKTSFKSVTAQYQIQILFFIANIGMAAASILIAITSQGRLPIPVNLYTISYLMYSLANVTTYWNFNNFFMVAAAKKIINLVQQALRKGNVVDLGLLIDLWIMLCDLNEQFVNIHSIIFLVIFTLLVICGIISVFATVLIYIYYNDQILGHMYLYSTVICVVGIMVLSESANSVVDHMVYKLKEQLLEEKLDVRNKTLLKVIQLFLHTIETRNPQVTFNGYMFINRSIVPSILSLAINFLVVLKQFTPD